MKNKLFFITLILLSCFIQANDDNCFTLLAGKDATESGSVIIAHNEDDRGNQLFVNIHSVKPKKNSSTFFLLKNGGKYPKPKMSHGFFWLEIPETQFADTYINHKNVAVASNSTPSRENNPAIEEGGIGFMLRRILAERAASARDAVKLAGRLINRFGYTDSGRTLCIADRTEAWVLHIVRGKHWIARRVPDNHVAIVPNAYTITTISDADDKDLLYSPGLIDHARARGWHNSADSTFNFAAAYSLTPLHRHRGNYLRQMRGINLLARQKISRDDPMPFSFEPRRKIRVMDIFNLLRDHYEGTALDLTEGYKTGSPNRTKNRTICTESTKYSFVAELRSSLNFKGFHAEALKSRIWIALGRPDSNSYSPWYPALSIANPGLFSFVKTGQALNKHFKPVNKPGNKNFSYPYRSYDYLSELVDSNYRTHIRPVKKEWRNLENYLFKNIRKKEKEFSYIFKVNSFIAEKIVVNYVSRLELRKWFRCLELISALTP